SLIWISVFFFSSRRRHTRFSRDWSSDVCSSDLSEHATPRMPSRENPWNSGTTGVGVITEVGEGVSRWRVGDQVFGLMDVRESNTCWATALWELGDIDPYEALCIEPAYVAFHAVRESQARAGESLAVIGLGRLGLLAVRMAVQAGAATVIAVDPLANRRAWALEHGVDYGLDPSAGDVALEIHAQTGGKGVDVA